MSTKCIHLLIICQLGMLLCASTSVLAEQTNAEIYAERMAFYERYAATSFVPWYYLAAIDQYERNIQRVRNDLPVREGVLAIQFEPRLWSGWLNPNPEDRSVDSIAFFGGWGKDGNGDGYADLENDDDVMYTLCHYLSAYNAYSSSRLDFRSALWEYYKREKTVDIIDHIAQIYRQFQTIDLDSTSFPLDMRYNYTYHNTWGDRRGWGGRRIHEGTDIFADYGTPVRATTYGFIEVLGWNEYGGWRAGIRDVRNNYHYYAHLSRFEKDIREGSIVEPGTVIGYVGSTGYGPPGTSGKFPPHLHYGMYKDNGRTEWSFDPYSYLKRWEREEKRSKAR